jgi:UDP-N-acetylmuramoyl-L-alanyl-D-glutamate--2,6-diaminopimelate ligase
MKLKILLKGAGISANGYADIEVNGIASNSKIVRKGFLFLALRGERFDGYDFIGEAIERGASVIVSHRDFIAPGSIVKIITNEGNDIASDLACAFFNNPSGSLKVIGITGTNGKTTTSYLIFNILEQGGFKAGLIGTIMYKIGDRNIPALNTTPGPVELQGYLSEMLERGINYAIMEVSSHSLEQGRVRNIKFASAVFTNITQDHLDYHKSFEGYYKAKAKLFGMLGEYGKGIINVDDDYGKRLLSDMGGKAITYGIDTPADITAKIYKMDMDGSIFEIILPSGRLDIHTRLIGTHNIYNILAAVSVGFLFGIEKERIRRGIESLDTVRGRLEEVLCGQPFKVFIDYAHTEDALKNILSILKPLTKGKLMLVFGCGGDRDKTKRPLMGKIAGKYSDYIIITSDNPRSEAPQAIADEICAGFEGSFDKYTVILDRLCAIKEVLKIAKSGDTVVIAGKGHETSQVLKDKIINFNDKESVEKILSGNI